VALAAPFLDGTELPMLITIAICAVMALVMSRLVVRGQAAAART
jgi:hypothetical protein